MACGLSSEELEAILAILKQFPEIEEAVLFGSRAMGKERRGSDVDIALKGREVGLVNSQVSFELNSNSVLPYYFDILDYQSIDNVELKSHIDRVGIVIYTRSSSKSLNSARKIPKFGPGVAGAEETQLE